jgi:glycosyltransferase involved in cell wall biosynthesis
MKKLLFITAFPPNNRSGGQTFSLHLLNDLSNRYAIDLIYFTYKDHEPDKSIRVNSAQFFNVDTLNCLRNCTRHPIFTRRFNPAILRYIKEIAPKYDIVFFDYTQTGIYSLYLDHPYKMLRCHDVLFQKFTRKDRLFRKWVSSTEERILKSVHKVFVPSEKDADTIKNIYSIDVFFTHEYLKDFSFYEFSSNKKVFVSYGLWSRKENVDGLIWFIRKVYPFINTGNGITFEVIGGGLSKKIVKAYLVPNNIQYLGFVDDPLDVLYRSSALIAPLFAGAGVKVKVIDAFTTGTPVIGTDIAFEGLPFIENLIYHADAPQGYINYIHNFPERSSIQKQENAAAFKRLYDNNHLLEQL